MLILCWNVAGLSTTVKRIHESYGNLASKTKKTKENIVLSNYIQRHGADIFCVQEHKIPLSQLSTRSEPQGCADVDGYESFWSCCVDQNKKGLNGVVTYVRKGTVPVLTANARPLGAPELDDQGRCVMTDHGNFVLFNVYVPASGQPLSYKMKFLNALRRAMQEQRTKFHKKVILVGDLNISHQAIDIFWSDRVLFVNDIRQQVARCENKATLPKWQLDIANAWPKIETALATKKVVPTQTTNSITNQKYDKHRMRVIVDEKEIFLGSHESHPGYCEYCYDFSGAFYTCEDSGETMVAKEENVISIYTIAELLLKITGIEWDDNLQRHIAATAGSVDRVRPSRKWLNGVLKEDDMVDAFRLFYPNSEGRYTCWNQNTNKRYTNEGARIDFTLVDRSLASFVRRGNVESLRCGHSSSSEQAHDPDSAVAALCAATAGDRFKPVSFQGGGIVEANQVALDSQFGVPHTGIVYTPPSFSDHTAISILLDDSCCTSVDVTRLDERDAATRRAQPHKAQKSISSFFSSAPLVNPGKGVKSTSFATNNKRKRGIQNYFATKGGTTSSNGATSHKSQPKKTVSTASKPSSILHHFGKQSD